MEGWKDRWREGGRKEERPLEKMLLSLGLIHKTGEGLNMVPAKGENTK